MVGWAFFMLHGPSLWSFLGFLLGRALEVGLFTGFISWAVCLGLKNTAWWAGPFSSCMAFLNGPHY
ncbi:hypothetical protein AXF42_Ash013345 [Apostasia shenzhenica]|uniref:Uncharacterized protein n=1 Tax=Apostasia shenzhenica TaxID=1088818 RepID=A0A2I0BBP7_9ASPA|nr:hypothetical protein AXF42_Ash013345 [Apostasia shenzhenica]